MKTQMQIYREVESQIASRDEHFMMMIKCKNNPLTNQDLKQLIAKYPERWSRYEAFIGKLKD